MIFLTPVNVVRSLAGVQATGAGLADRGWVGEGRAVVEVLADVERAADGETEPAGVAEAVAVAGADDDGIAEFIEGDEADEPPGFKAVGLGGEFAGAAWRSAPLPSSNQISSPARTATTTRMAARRPQ